MSQHENRYVSEMGEYVCTKCCSFVHYKTLHKYVASCFIYLKYAKLMETQLSRTNFATQQKEWLGKHCPNFTDKDSQLPNSPYLNPLSYHVWGAMLDKFQELKPTLQKVTDLKRHCRLSGTICQMKHFANLF